MKVLIQPSRLAVILLLVAFPLSAVRQCCIPSVIKTQTPSHCSHLDESDAPEPAACKAPDVAVVERVPNSVELDNLRVEIPRLSIALSGDVLMARNGWTFQHENDSGPPADLAFLRHSPLLI